MAIIIPGINTTEEAEYEKKLRMAEHVASLIQIDIGDGRFTPKETLGAPTIKKFGSSKDLEIQLMVFHPLPYIVELAKLPFVARILFPLESEDDFEEVIYKIKSSGKIVGISLNPETPVGALAPYFEKIDYMQFLANNPGPSGQKLKEETYDRIRDIKKMDSSLPVEVDIGVNFETTPKLVEAGADLLVSTSAIYNAPDFYVAYEKLAKLAAGT
ncbi:hypothetical protein HY024_02415 [Candidatus Curtissbacteria bacterium]|nr:hypothetical protein [Candidatus Curtissbacteria bacterium]